MVCRRKPVADDKASTLAPGTTDREASITVPFNEALSTCASAGRASTNKRRARNILSAILVGSDQGDMNNRTRIGYKISCRDPANRARYSAARDRIALKSMPRAWHFL